MQVVVVELVVVEVVVVEVVVVEVVEVVEVVVVVMHVKDLVVCWLAGVLGESARTFPISFL